MPKPSAVSYPEACRTPAGRDKASHQPVSGRHPTTLNKSGCPNPALKRSAAEGKADVIGPKPDIGARMFAVGSEEDVLAT